MENKICQGSLTNGTGCLQCGRCFHELLEVARDMTDIDECSYDHHGLCQTHGIFHPCPHGTMNKILEIMDRSGKQ